jgi:CHAD domain-containing protein
MPTNPPTNPNVRHVLAALHAQLEALGAHELGTRAGRDPEELHQMRVAVRRLRAILRAARSLFERKWVRELRSELDWLSAALGRVRDLDVARAYLAGEVAALEPVERGPAPRLLRRLDADRARARDALRVALDSPRYPKLLTRLRTSMARPRLSASDVSLVDVAAAEFRKLRRAAKALPGHPDADDLHEIRIKVKRARYAAELVAGAAGQRGARFIEQAKALQDILGEHQDAVVIEEYLHENVDGGEAAQALGKHLLKRQRKRRKKARGAFFEEWPKLERRGRKAWSATPAT